MRLSVPLLRKSAAPAIVNVCLIFGVTGGHEGSPGYHEGFPREMPRGRTDIVVGTPPRASAGYFSASAPLIVFTFSILPPFHSPMRAVRPQSAGRSGKALPSQVYVASGPIRYW